MSTPLLSPKDAAAPTLDAAVEPGLLPSYDDCLAWYRDGARRTERPVRTRAGPASSCSIVGPSTGICRFAEFAVEVPELRRRPV